MGSNPIACSKLYVRNLVGQVDLAEGSSTVAAQGLVQEPQ